MNYWILISSFCIYQAQKCYLLKLLGSSDKCVNILLVQSQNFRNVYEDLMSFENCILIEINVLQTEVDETSKNVEGNPNVKKMKIVITPSDKENAYKAAVKLQLQIYGCHEIGKINILMHKQGKTFFYCRHFPNKIDVL